MKKTKNDQRPLLAPGIQQVSPRLFIMCSPVCDMIRAVEYYFRVCAKVRSHPKLKAALIMNFVAGEEAECAQAQG